MQQQVIEEIEADRANELLELRSRNIKSLIAARSRGWTPVARDYAAENATNARVKQLETEMRRIRSTYEYKGYSGQEAPPALPGKKNLSSVTYEVDRAHGRTLRGGWPTQEVMFGGRQPGTRPSSASVSRLGALDA